MPDPSLLLACLTPLLSFFFGWTLLARFFPLDAEERFAAAWGVGFAVLGYAEFLAFAAGLPQAPLLAGVLAAMGVASLALRLGSRRSSVGQASSLGWTAWVWLLGLVHLLGVQLLLTQYVGADWYGDWCMHYEEAQVFLGKQGIDWAFIGQYTLASRTPLFNFVAAAVLALSGDDFGTYQLAASWMNGCFPLALYLLVRDRFGVRAGRLSLLLAPLNVWMLHEAWFTWQKMLAAYFLLLGLHFYLRFLRKWADDPAAAWPLFFLSWLCGLLGFMTHQVAIVYIAALVVHAAWTGWRSGAAWPRLRDWAAWLVSAAALIGPWQQWLLAKLGREMVLRSSPTSIMLEAAAGMTWFEKTVWWLDLMVRNTFTTLVPTQLMDELQRDPSSLAAFNRGMTDFYFSLLTGALTLSLTAWLAVTAARGWKGRGGRAAWRPSGEDSALRLWIVAGLLGGLVLHPNLSSHGLAHNACYPACLLLVGLAWGALSRAPRRVQVLVLVGMVAEFLALFWSHVRVAVSAPAILDPLLVNPGQKTEDGLVFLADRLGAAYAVAVTAVIVLQVTFAVLLVVWLRAARRDGEA